LLSCWPKHGFVSSTYRPQLAASTRLGAGLGVSAGGIHYRSMARALADDVLCGTDAVILAWARAWGWSRSSL